MHRSTFGSTRARLVAAAAGVWMMAAACGPGSAPPPPPAPASMPVPAPTPAPGPPPAQASDGGWRDVVVCVVDEQGVRNVPARYNLVTRDTLVDGRPYSEVFPTDGKYAAGAEWYINGESLPRDAIYYGRFGLPRIREPGELVSAGEYQGVLIFTERDPGDPAEVLFAAVRPRCEFQPYSWSLVIGEVRG